MWLASKLASHVHATVRPSGIAKHYGLSEDLSPYLRNWQWPGEANFRFARQPPIKDAD